MADFENQLDPENVSLSHAYAEHLLNKIIENGRIYNEEQLKNNDKITQKINSYREVENFVKNNNLGEEPTALKQERQQLQNLQALVQEDLHNFSYSEIKTYMHNEILIELCDTDNYERINKDNIYEMYLNYNQGLHALFELDTKNEGEFPRKYYQNCLLQRVQDIKGSQKKDFLKVMSKDDFLKEMGRLFDADDVSDYFNHTSTKLFTPRPYKDPNTNKKTFVYKSMTPDSLKEFALSVRDMRSVLSARPWYRKTFLSSTYRACKQEIEKSVSYLVNKGLDEKALKKLVYGSQKDSARLADDLMTKSEANINKFLEKNQAKLDKIEPRKAPEELEREQLEKEEVSQKAKETLDKVIDFNPDEITKDKVNVEIDLEEDLDFSENELDNSFVEDTSVEIDDMEKLN